MTKSIGAEANTLVPAFLVLEELGFSVSRIEIAGQPLAQYLPFVLATALVAGRLTSWRQVLVHGILVSCMAILGILTSAWLLGHVTGRSLFAGAGAGQVSMVFLLAFAGGIVWTGVLYVLLAVARRLRPSPA